MDSSMILPALQSLLPPEIVDAIETHVLHPRAPVQVLLGHVSQELQRALALLLPLVQPLVDRALALMAESQGLVGLVVSVLVVTVVFAVLSWVHRIVMFWTRVAMRLVFWTLLVAVGAWIWQRGVFESARDAVVVGGKIVGYMAVIKDVWVREYNRYEAQQTMAGRRGRGGSR
ncbi:hypothetical protein S40288_05646 [Stachybotrys chartarum IBT 40288]|nr:hypothetical protein S40288_05646 [Stachybotrys chartarum IBT 40288]